MHSIELLLDPATDEAVRADWARLTEAGLPSQGRHTGATNAPHVTLLAATSLDGSHDDELGALLRSPPLAAGCGGLVVFGRPPRGLVLARGIVVSEGILRLQRYVYETVAPDADLAPHSTPGSWTPHVTLASRLAPDELAAAVAAVSEVEPPEGGTFAAGRRWDSTARRVTPLAG